MIMTIILSKVDLFLLVTLEIFSPCRSVWSSQTLWSFNSSTGLKRKKQIFCLPFSKALVSFPSVLPVNSWMKFVIVWACLEFSVKDLAQFSGSDIRSVCSLLWSKKYPARSHTWTRCKKSSDVFASLFTTEKMS